MFKEIDGRMGSSTCKKMKSIKKEHIKMEELKKYNN